MINKFTTKDCIYAAVGGFITSLMLILGVFVKKSGTVFGYGTKIFYIVPLFAICTGVFLLLFVLMKKSGKKTSNPLPNRLVKSSFLYFVLIFAMVLILWLPSLLAVYPGLYTYDASWQHDMYKDSIVTEHHPVWHTYLLGWCTETFRNADGMNKGVLLYTVIQMLFMGAGCAYILYLLHRRKEPTLMHVFALAFFCLYPPFVIFVLTNTKDSIFAIAIADFLLLNLELIENKERFFGKISNMVSWVVLFFLISTLRNNAVYALVIVFPFFLWKVLSKPGKKLRAVCMVTIALTVYLVYKYPITNAITVEGIAEREKLSVPCQQVMRVYTYHKNELSDSEKSAIRQAFESTRWNMYYQPQIADPAKGAFDISLYEEKKDECIKFWMDLGKKYPAEYVDSFLENTYGFWYPWPRYVSYSDGRTAYTPIECKDPAAMNSKLPKLLEFFKLFENSSVVDGNAFISWLFSPALFLYMAIFAAFFAIKEKGFKYILPFLFIALLWATYLLGPVAAVRYALFLFPCAVIWPAYIRSCKQL